MKKMIVSILFGGLTFFTMAYSIVLKKGQQLDPKLIFAYLVVSIVVSIYTFLVQHYHLKRAALASMIVFLISSVMMILTMPVQTVGFEDLGILIFWFGVNLITALIGLMVELIIAIKNHYKQ